MFLDYEAADLRWGNSMLAAGLRGSAEIAPGLVGRKLAIRRHEDSFASGYNLTLAKPQFQSVEFKDEVSATVSVLLPTSLQLAFLKNVHCGGFAHALSSAKRGAPASWPCKNIRVTGGKVGQVLLSGSSPDRSISRLLAGTAALNPPPHFPANLAPEALSNPHFAERAID